MQTLTIKKLQPVNSDLLEQLLEDKCELVTLDQINWSDFPYKPDVKFRIAHTGDQILLKFYVQEENIQAKASTVNGDVYKDSCVEFFLAPKGDNYYYNFEFSCIGIPHIGYGDNRYNRQLLPVEKINMIKTRSSLGTEPFDERRGGFSWELFIQIPVDCLINDGLESLDGISAKGNFYKCGDELSEPHFVTWNPVKTEKPDYHRPEFFGSVKFE